MAARKGSGERKFVTKDLDFVHVTRQTPAKTSVNNNNKTAVRPNNGFNCRPSRCQTWFNKMTPGETASEASKIAKGKFSSTEALALLKVFDIALD